jgi:uncharacterized integral membrane protein (TIGR00698 family)
MTTHGGWPVPGGRDAAEPGEVLLLLLALGLAAGTAGWFVPSVGAPIFAVAGGVLLSPLAKTVASRTGNRESILASAKGPVLRFSIVLLGAQLSLGEVASVGVTSLPVMLGTLAVCLVLAWVAGRRLGIPGDLRTLIGVGTGICGASAIAAVTPALRARSGDVAYAVSTIFFFNVAAVLVFPPLGHLLGLDQRAFGLFAGTAVNDTSAVVAAATSYGPVAAQHAVVVKLVRTLMIIPVTLVLSKGARAPKPWFLAAFLLVAAANTLGLVPDELQLLLHRLALFCIAVALAAVGLSTDVAALRRAGPRPLLLGLILWIAVSVTSLALQQLTGV